MNSDNIKWLIIGLSGAAFSMLLVIGTLFAAYQFWMKNLIDVAMYEASSEEEMAEEEEEESQELRIQEERARAMGLHAIYENLYLTDNSRYLLYEEEAFDVVASRLADRLNNADTPLAKYRYSQSISNLTELYGSTEPDSLHAVLNKWVEHEPNSYIPLLVRGGFRINLGYHYRGSGWAHEVTPEGRSAYRRYCQQACDDLLKALEIKPDLPDAHATMISALAGAGGDLATMLSHYEQALALNPNHLHARWSMVNYAMPKWFGSWSLVDSLVEECEASSSEFPLLMNVSRMAMGQMELRGPAYEDRWGSKEASLKWFRAHRDLAAQYPDDLHVIADAAYFALHADQYEEACIYYLQLGLRFPTGSKHNTLDNYHRARIEAFHDYIMGKNDDNAPSETLTRLIKLLEIAPDDILVISHFLEYLETTRDEGAANYFFENIRSPFITEVGPGSKPNQELIEAMMLATHVQHPRGPYADENGNMMKALSLAPDSPYVRFACGFRLYRLNYYEEAKVQLEKALSLDENHLPAIAVLSWITTREGDCKRATDLANRFLSAPPSEFRDRFAESATYIIAECVSEEQTTSL